MWPMPFLDRQGSQKLSKGYEIFHTTIKWLVGYFNLTWQTIAFMFMGGHVTRLAHEQTRKSVIIEIELNSKILVCRYFTNIVMSEYGYGSIDLIGVNWNHIVFDCNTN